MIFRIQTTTYSDSRSAKKCWIEPIVYCCDVMKAYLDGGDVYVHESTGKLMISYDAPEVRFCPSCGQSVTMIEVSNVHMKAVKYKELVERTKHRVSRAHQVRRGES